MCIHTWNEVMQKLFPLVCAWQRDYRYNVLPYSFIQSIYTVATLKYYRYRYTFIILLVTLTFTEADECRTWIEVRDDQQHWQNAKNERLKLMEYFNCWCGKYAKRVSTHDDKMTETGVDIGQVSLPACILNLDCIGPQNLKSNVSDEVVWTIADESASFIQISSE